MNTQLVKNTPFHLIGQDERGMTADFQLSRQQQDFIFLTRKAGSESGNTYHEGKNSGTTPKTFILLSGKILFSYRKVNTETVYQEEINAPAKIEVQPLVVHKVEALTEISMLECNSIADIQGDRVKQAV
jgi:hypothetical protein